MVGLLSIANTFGALGFRKDFIDPQTPISSSWSLVLLLVAHSQPVRSI